jgi:hypothetical protein
MYWSDGTLNIHPTDLQQAKADALSLANKLEALGKSKR